MIWHTLGYSLLLAASGEASRKYRDYPKGKEIDIVEESKNETTALTLFGILF